MAKNDEKLTCSVCGFQFRIEEARATICQQCPLRGNCRLLVKCPNCGYEMPLIEAPNWLSNLISRLGSWVSGRKR